MFILGVKHHLLVIPCMVKGRQAHKKKGQCKELCWDLTGNLLEAQWEMAAIQQADKILNGSMLGWLYLVTNS